MLISLIDSAELKWNTSYLQKALRSADEGAYIITPIFLTYSK